MEKVLAINSGSSSFKYKLFSLPDEKVIAKGMADRVGLDYASFEIKLADGTKHVEKTEIPDQEAAVSLLLKFLLNVLISCNFPFDENKSRCEMNFFFSFIEYLSVKCINRNFKKFFHCNS